MKEVLCFDIGSGGMSAARFNEQLEVSGYAEIPWEPPLTADIVLSVFKTLSRKVQGDELPAALSISSFMHSFLLLGWDGSPQSPVYTWMDDAAPSGIEAIRDAVGNGFHERTGCRYHPMFPVFKLAALKPAKGIRVASPKTLLVEALTGNFVEDYGMAAASGLLDARSGEWDADILRAAHLSPASLPQLLDADAIVWRNSDTAVVNGSGDGFMANIGSGCESSKRIAITLGTSAAVRQMVTTPSLDPQAGTFCYRAGFGNAFLLGCASNNGGNALDWARREFGVSTSTIPKRDIPIFLPWLNGERSLEWNSMLRPQWHGRTSQHTPAELFRSVMEGVVFNLAQYVEVIEKSSGIRASEIVLSGNGFLDPAVAPVLAALVSRPVLQPESSGLGTLRGTAVCAWRALGHDATPAVERLLESANRVIPVDDPGLPDRYHRFKEFR